MELSLGNIRVNRLRKVNQFLFVLNAAAVLLLTATLLPSAIRYLSTDRSPPVAGFTRAEASPHVVIGRWLHVTYDRTKMRADCRVEAYRYVSSADTGRIYDLPPAKHQGGPADIDTATFAYDVHEIPNGIYDINVTLLYYCPNISSPFEYRLPLARFKINRPQNYPNHLIAR